MVPISPISLIGTIVEYQQHLAKQNLDRQNINNLIADVEEFYQLTFDQ